MKTNLKELSGKLSFEELSKVKLEINHTVNKSDAISWFKFGHIIGYYNPITDEDVIVDSVNMIEDAASAGYELFDKKHYI